MILDIKTVLEGRSSLKSFLTIPTTLKIYLLDEPIIYKKADRIIAVSNELKEDIKKQCKIPEEKLVTIPNGIDVNKFKPMNVEDLREKWKLTDEKVILSVGRIDEQKGFNFLLKILPDILKGNKVKLFVIGTGLYLEKLKKMTKKLKIEDKTIFTGRIPHENLPKYYNLAEVFIMPTMLSEGLPLVIPEAMACEKPVIASNIGGIPTVIENYKDGILIEPGNLKELKERFLEVLNDDELASKLGKNARKKVVEKFSLDRMVENTIKVYEEVLGR